MKIENKNIDYLYLKKGEISLSFDEKNNKTSFLISYESLKFKNEYDNNNLLFQLVEKNYFKMLGLLFEKTNRISLKNDIIIDKNSSTIEAIVNDDKFLTIGKYNWSDIHDSLFYIRLNNKLIPKNIIIKQNKI